jgi:hypothetical protein
MACMGLSDELSEQFREARRTITEKAPGPTFAHGSAEDRFERQTFETSAVGLLEVWVARLAQEVDELRAEIAKRGRNS